MPLLYFDLSWSECIPKYVLKANVSTGTMNQVQDDRQQAADLSGGLTWYPRSQPVDATKTTFDGHTSPQTTAFLYSMVNIHQQQC